MKINFVNIALVLALAVSWALPILSVIYNQRNPSYESALGVAYGFLFGCIVHVVVVLIWIAVRRFGMEQIEWIALLASLAIMILLTVVGDTGTLSRMG